jgi:hypothetical protein
LHRDAPRLRHVFQDKTADLEAQHAQEAELLRVAWVLELNAWGDSVIMLRSRLDQKTPDARWLSDFLRKTHRAQRCYETAVELETFLTNFCADPEQPLQPDMWSKPCEDLVVALDKLLPETYRSDRVKSCAGRRSLGMEGEGA